MATSQIIFTKILNTMEKHNAEIFKNSKFLYKKTFHKITKIHLQKTLNTPYNKCLSKIYPFQLPCLTSFHSKIHEKYG
jgi:hypothetical protein